MFLFGVTGGIGSGKTTVCSLLKQKGLPIIEADPLAKKLTSTLPQIREALTKAFGEDIFDDCGLNKQKLSQLVFTDPKIRQRINQIIHPHVLRGIKKEIKRLQTEEKQPLIGIEAALIYESELDKMLDAVVVVTAPFEKRIQWIQQRNQLSRDEILKRIAAQMPDSQKSRRADYLINNDDSLKQLQKQVEQLHEWLRKQSD